MNQEKIGNFIKEIRVKNNLTQKELADKLGVTYQAVSKWENGKNIPDISILKEISNIFNVDIDEIINGEIKEKKNKRKLLYVLFLIIIIIGVIVFFFLNHDHNFEFKTLTSNCSEFDLTGSMAYNKDKTSIYISNINYCGNEENKLYDKIECVLYEEYGNTKTEISSCENSDSAVTLGNYLKNAEIKVNDYTASCKKFLSSNLYLEISAYDKNKITTYKIPITINDNCMN